MIEKALLEKVKIQKIITDQRAFNLKKGRGGEGGAKFPGSPVVRARCFHCQGRGLIPGWGAKILQAMQHSQKRERESF